VVVDGEVIGQIGAGLLAFVGVAKHDGQTDTEYIASKICDLRVFTDDGGRMNRSVQDVNGAVLVVSQFTLLGDARRGRRPAFDAAAAPEHAKALYETLLDRLRASGLDVAAGRFRADMTVESINDGPVTILLDSRRVF
jgi:D-tyrosyl-tRNA(Tyr) deacylase